MCLKVQPPWPMPEETGRIGMMSLRDDDPCRSIGDQLFSNWYEEEFADLYSHEGQPGYSPFILAFVKVFQFTEKLAGQQAAQVLRRRLDWKYALHFEPGLVMRSASHLALARFSPGLPTVTLRKPRFAQNFCCIIPKNSLHYK